MSWRARSCISEKWAAIDATVRAPELICSADTARLREDGDRLAPNSLAESPDLPEFLKQAVMIPRKPEVLTATVDRI